MKILTLVPPTKHTKNVARDLVYGCWCKGRRIAGVQFPPISQLMVATTLLKAGHEVRLLDALALRMSLPDIQRVVEQEKYDVVITLTNTTTINEDSETFLALKEVRPQIKTVIFGAHPTFRPLDSLKKPGIDIIILKEVEFVVKDLMAALDQGGDLWKSCQGIGYRDNGDFIIRQDYPFIRDLDQIPIPDRSLLPKDVDYFNPEVKHMPYTTMFTARGCPGKCTYCTSPPFYGQKIRAMSAKRVVDEMQEVERLGYKEVFFRDEIFTVSRKRTLEICQMIKERGIRLSWLCSSRVDYIDKEMMVEMKSAGCHMIRFGIESSDQGILDRIKKEVLVEDNRNVFQWAREAGLDTHAHMMIGMPGETQETIDRTLQFLIECNPSAVTMGIFTPYPGTAIFDEVAELYPEIGDGSDKDLSTIHTQGYFSHVFTKLSQEELHRNIRKVYRKFYCRPDFVLGWLKRIHSFDELRRVSIAGTQVLEFAFGQN